MQKPEASPKDRAGQIESAEVVGQFGLAKLAPLQVVDFANSKLTHHQALKVRDTK
jgi:hypothetical protein